MSFGPCEGGRHEYRTLKYPRHFSNRMKDAFAPCAYAKAELVLVILHYFRECKLSVLWPKLVIYTSLDFDLFGLVF